MRISVWTLGAVAAAGLTLCGIPAAAQTYYADGPNAGGSAVLSIQVRAAVGGRCGFAAAQTPNGTFDQPNFDETGFSHDFTFQLECTGPSRVAVVSTNGGLKTGGTAPAGYATLAPYDVMLNLVGSSATASATCAVANLTATAGAPCEFRGPATTTAGLRLNSNSILQNGSFLRVSAPVYSGADALVSGTYGDTLTVTVSVAP
ncbi:hypothetical protein [Sphingomonas sp. MS122]|uniref:hypothetical protein n=1 Tax=Sphingomonas sp. MS122 TaxID=3412683 RepID=UPI003C2D1629